MIAFAGRVGEDVEALFDEGFSQIVSINEPNCDLATALKNAEQHLQNSCEDITRHLLLNHAEQDEF
ncbi:Glycerate kinase family protein [compost metagenome]